MTRQLPMLCGIDIETTGLEFETDWITEIGWVIKRFKDPKPLEVRTHFIQGAPEISEEIQQLTKITPKILQLAGLSAHDVYNRLMQDCIKYGVDFIVAHNGENFDKPFMKRFAERVEVTNFWEGIADIPWLDTKEDIVYPSDIRMTNLIYVSACLGFVNPFPHAAVFDAFTTLKVLEHFDIRDVIARSQEPWITVRALVKAPFHDPAPEGQKEKDKAKERRYRWQDCSDGKHYDKCWVKRIKQSELQKEVEEAPFKVVEIRDDAKEKETPGS